MNPLANALELLQVLDALRPISENQEKRIWQKFRIDWNFHSNHLEGNSLTYGETKSLLLHNITAQGKPLKDHLEITGHNEALLEIQDTVKQQRPITESFLRQLHTLILKERYQVDAQTADGQATRKWVEVGQYKTQPNHVLTVTGETFRFAEPFEVAAKMETLVRESNSDCATPEAALLLAAKIHYQFVLIHPFDDGNGRMARILMNLVLMRHSFPPAIIKTQAKEDYFSALRQADGGQFEVFAQYIAARVKESLAIMIAGARGEDIDELDDLDKKIALFVATAKDRNGQLAIPKNLDTVREFNKTVTVKIVELLLQKTRKFDPLYSTVTRFIGSEDGTSSVIGFAEAIANPASLNRFFSELQITEKYQQLSLSDKHPTYLCTVKFVFEVFKINVWVDSVWVAQATYNAANNDAFVRAIIEVVIKRHLTWLQKETGLPIEI